MKNRISYICMICILALLSSCRGDIKPVRMLSEEAAIFPDYKGVTIPCNIAPLNFSLQQGDDACLIIEGTGLSFQVRSDDGCFNIPCAKWKDMLTQNRGKKIKITVCVQRAGEWCAYRPFYMEVAVEPIDKYMAYRLIPPGYELWNKMGIYQRCLEDYDQSAIYENTLTNNNCVNCHSFCMQSPDKMLFHSRAKYPATVLIQNGEIEKLNTKTGETVSPLVYPSWHPSGRFIAFSVNKTNQSFHNHHPNRVEVYDSASDVVVYDVARHCIVSSPLIKSDAAFETFPTFSPDGKSLYFCSSRAVSPMPERFKEVKYSLCRIDFDPSTCRFGNRVDTLVSASRTGKSVSFPRVSPDGRFLAFTLHQYGNFSIWHKDADLYLINLTTRQVSALAEANSRDVESYHSWSHNSRWMVFSSRRIDGLYTRPFITYIDKNGRAHKPFVLPQKNPAKYYKSLMYSYNIPEMIMDKVKVNAHSIATKLKDDPGIGVAYKNE